MMSDESTKSAEQNWPSLYRWCMVVSATFTKVENVTWGCNLSATFSTEVHHIWLSHDQLRAALLIGQNAVKFDIHHYRMMNVSTVDRVTLQCCTVTWLQHCNMSCTSSLVDDAMFAHNGHQRNRRREWRIVSHGGRRIVWFTGGSTGSGTE